MEQNSQEKNQNSPIFIIVILVILALVIAFFAFNGSDDEVSQATSTDTERVVDNVATSAEEAGIEAELLTARLQAKAELVALEARMAADENYDQAQQDIANIKASLNAAYVNVSMEATESWIETKVAFDEAEANLRTGTGNVLELIGGLILVLEADVRVDEEDEMGVTEDEV